MRKYKHIFFDLDRTLWDYEANARQAFYDLFEEFDLNKHIPDIELFIAKFHVHNEHMWTSYRKGFISKDFLRFERFHQTLQTFDVDDLLLAERVGERYLERTPLNKHVIPETYEVLGDLREKGYLLHVITNGFKKVQMQKLETCELLPFFTRVITSEDVRHQKPHREIFEYALKVNNAGKQESIMIGDDWEVDIMGARRFGMDQVYFNPDRHSLTGDIEPTYEIHSLKELKEIL